MQDIRLVHLGNDTPHHIEITPSDPLIIRLWRRTPRSLKALDQGRGKTWNIVQLPVGIEVLDRSSEAKGPREETLIQGMDDCFTLRITQPTEQDLVWQCASTEGTSPFQVRLAVQADGEHLQVIVWSPRENSIIRLFAEWTPGSTTVSRLGERRTYPVDIDYRYFTADECASLVAAYTHQESLEVLTHSDPYYVVHQTLLSARDHTLELLSYGIPMSTNLAYIVREHSNQPVPDLPRP